MNWKFSSLCFVLSLIVFIHALKLIYKCRYYTINKQISLQFLSNFTALTYFFILVFSINVTMSVVALSFKRLLRRLHQTV